MQIEKKFKKGFTLLELLIVIGILAILATAATLVLNPAELLRQARDTQRIADLDALKTAIALYITDTNGALTIGPFSTANATCGLGAGTCTPRNNYDVAASSTNWVGINLSAISTGSPLSILPRDPVNDATYQYAYAGASDNTFELNGRLESAKYRIKMKNDGGDDSACTFWTESDCYYEGGTDPGLNL